MKLRNLMYATMIACAFASCSKDDEVINGGETAKGDANLTIELTTAGTATKATTTESMTGKLTNEDLVQTLTLVVFDAQGKYLADATASITDQTRKEVSIKSLPVGSIQFMLFANMSLSNLNAMTATTIYSQAIPVADYAASIATKGLPMTSAIKTATLVSGNNYYGYTQDEKGTGTYFSVGTPVSLVRNVARVDLASLMLDMSQSDYTAGTATFTFENVFMANASDATTLANANGMNKYTGESFGTQTDVLTYYNEAKAGATSLVQDIATATATNVDAPKAYFYVLANNLQTKGVNGGTVLVVKGKFKLENGVKGNVTENLAETEGYYPVYVGVDGLASAEGTVNNHVYNINITVAGQGKSTPFGDDKANFFVKATVDDWAYLTQSSVIK